MIQVDGVLIPFAPSPQIAEVELPIPADAQVLGWILREQNLGVEIQYAWDPQATQPIPRRVSTAFGSGARVFGARHLFTYEWLDQLWHVFVEVDEE